MGIHQYIERHSGKIVTEKAPGDGTINLLYSVLQERSPKVFRALTGQRTTDILGFFAFDPVLNCAFADGCQALRKWGVDPAECYDDPGELTTPRKVFERRISYWSCRPLPASPGTVVSPADARLLLGSFRETSALFIKHKFFDYEELLGADKRHWLRAFYHGDFALLRLTPDKYHYTHAPVTGRVMDIYGIDGTYHSCNPGAMVRLVNALSKNKRVVTIIDTDVPAGSQVGLVAMIEIVAMMIGEILQCYSHERYDDPQPVLPGMFLERGRPKGLFRPGSSSVVLVFQPDRVRFAGDLIRNQHHQAACSRFSFNFQQSLVETDVQVRSAVADRIEGNISHD
ncbi:phosphatidylserine decarboxylase [bacterium]|nr:phosphatidylserine decarboxylase [candidate division CSSED10-310 bacterium]